MDGYVVSFEISKWGDGGLYPHFSYFEDIVMESEIPDVRCGLQLTIIFCESDHILMHVAHDTGFSMFCF